MKRKKIPSLCTAAAMTAALTASANAAAVAVFDFGSSRGTATAQNFINTGADLVETTDTVTLVSNGTLGAATSNTAFSIGAGLSLTIDSTANAFTYGNSIWTGDADVNLMGDAWLFNGLGASGTKSLTLSGLSSTLTTNQNYRIYFLGSYGANEYTKFGDVTYDGVNYGTQDGGQPIVDGSNIVTNPADMAVSFDFSTDGTVEDILTFSLGKATGSTGGAAGIQGFAIVQVPEPSSSALLGLGALTLILRRRK